ncbi:orotidine-5'-phosphate decarboxylase [Marisediminicola sp. LYQ134]|uniref:orotidine-5'-phosphate decarboxylase n=1 Tax=Marisediminicola sp. LYQ134 TaxID=3391061 RepID=UPI0039839628
MSNAEPGAPTFGGRLADALRSHGRLCVGIDPHPYLLNAWSLPDSAAGLESFGLAVVEAAVGSAGIVKPQAAFFERHGSAGFAALEVVIGAARERGLVVIADVKRGDVGSSVEAYGEAWLSAGSPLESDAMTVSAFQGFGSLDAPLALAREHGKGLFVLGATSNPESRDIQSAIVAHGPRSGSTVSRAIVDDVLQWNAAEATAGPGSIASVGLVLGATVDIRSLGIDPDTLGGEPSTPVLAPGFGHQGADVADLPAIYGAAARATIVNGSRGLLSAGPDALADTIARAATEVTL